MNREPVMIIGTVLALLLAAAPQLEGLLVELGLPGAGVKAGFIVLGIVVAAFARHKVTSPATAAGLNAEIKRLRADR